MRATNDEDTGLWSTSGEGITDSVTRAVDENTATDVAFGDPVTAAGGGTLNYSLSGHGCSIVRHRRIVWPTQDQGVARL